MCSDVATSGKNTNLGGCLFGLKIVENLLMGYILYFV